MSDLAFSSLPLAPSWLDNLAQLEYREMTPIQALALPALLAGRDVLGQAGTGTGKTAAFGLSLLARLGPRGGAPGALVLCPTRELAAQIAEELRRLARPLPHVRVRTLSGGSSIQRERASLEGGVDIVVGTPGRVLDHLVRERLDLSEIRTVVLDEADRMLEMGFIDQVTQIVRATSSDRQTLLFSATFTDEIRALGATLQRDALHVVAPADDVAARVTQLVYEGGPDALLRILGHHRPASCVVFCNHRETCDVVAASLRRAGHAALALHGGMEQHDRNTVLLLLANGSLRVLVATDVAARGLDIDDLGAVVNYDLPATTDLYIHRIGRTARAGREGLAISIAGPGMASLPALPIQKLPAASDDLAPPPAMITIAIQGGRQDRLRPGDIVGALVTDVGLAGTDIGKISITDRISFVAITAAMGDRALAGLAKGRIKNRRFRSYRVVPPVTVEDRRG